MKHMFNMVFLALVACQVNREIAQPATIPPGERLTVTIEATENGFDIYAPDGYLIAEYFTPNDSSIVAALADVSEIAIDYRENPDIYRSEPPAEMGENLSKLVILKERDSHTSPFWE